MNDEIREMLEEMKSIIDTGKDINGIKVDGYGFHGRDLKLLYDYITNLQKEKEDYKSRAEKAVEKSQELKDSIDKSNFDGMTKTILILGINQIQNILQNGSEN